MSKKFEIIRDWYNKGFWTKEMVHNAVLKSWITESEYKEIVGEN